MGECKPQTRRVKQEAIDGSLLLLNESSTSRPSHPAVQPPSEVQSELLPSIPNAPTAASSSRTVKKEEDPEEKLLQKTRADSVKAFLWEVWKTTPAIPSATSRTALAKARGVPPALVHSWYSRRKRGRKKDQITSHPEDEYDIMTREQPLATVDDEPNLATEVTPMESSSLPPSSPPHTPPRLASPMDTVEIANSSPPTDPGRIRPITLKVPLPFRKSSLPHDSAPAELVPSEAGASVAPVNATSAANSATSGSAAKGAKRGRKRKVKAEEIDITIEESAGMGTKPVPKKKRQRVNKTKPAAEPVTPAPLVIGAQDSVAQKPEMNLFLAPGTPTNRTVPPHSPLAKIYTSVLVAPFILGENLDPGFAPPGIPFGNEFAPVQDPFVANPSPYISRPMPPLPMFEALDRGSYINDCREALRASLKINSELGLWDLVVESLPASYYMDLGKDLDIEWPEIDWP